MLKELKIVSLNTWKNEGAYIQRLPVMANGLERLNADVILVQECFYCEDTEDDTAAYLADHLDLKFVFAKARRKLRQHGGEMRDCYSGLAILSNGVFEDSITIPLPSSDIGGERIALSSRLTIGEITLKIVCVHFSHVRGEEEIRANQIRASLNAIQEDDESDILVIGGDFNCLPDSEEISLGFAGLNLSLVNHLFSMGCRDPTNPIPPVSNCSERQIDQIWHLVRRSGPSLQASAGVSMNKPDPEGVYPSDHAAVWLRLKEPSH